MSLDVTLSEPARQLGFRLQALGANAAATLVAEQSSIPWVARAVRVRQIRWKGCYRLRTAEGDVPGLVGVVEDTDSSRRAVVIVWWADDRWRSVTSLGTLRGATKVRAQQWPSWGLPPAAARRSPPRPQLPSPA